MFPGCTLTIVPTSPIDRWPGSVNFNMRYRNECWHDWAEGNHLEPRQRWGRACLEATRAAVDSLETLLRRQVAFLPQLLSYSFGGEPDAAERLDVKGSAGV